MPLKVPVIQTGLEASIEAAAKKAGKSLKINLGSSAKSIEGLSQPLGRITGKADQFTKSMEAANARVLAFGASVGVLSAVQRGFANLVSTTIEVEKSLASINSILGANAKQLEKFKSTIFDVARNTEQSFETVATAALELSRQGLKAEEVTKRLNDALVLSRLSGLGATEAVAGLTAAINSFNATGITSAEVLNKLSAAAVSAAVSERDLIEGIKRSGSVAIQAGVSFDELIGVITAVQARTARGGAVIGNSFKTIFTRIQSLDKLKTMQNLGVQVTDTSGEVLSATKLIQNLGNTLKGLPDARRLQIAENLVGKFQIAPFLAILEDYNKETSTAIKVTDVASKATTEAYGRNIALNQTLSAAINSATVNLKELADTLGKIGITDSLKNVLGFFNSLVGDVKNLLDGDGIGSDFAKGFVKAIGGIISGPGLAIFGAIIAKLTLDLTKFGLGSLKTFFGLNRAAKEQATLQGQIASTLLGNEGIQKQILAIENSQLSAEQKKVAQTKFFTTALNEQLAVMQKMQGIALRVTPGVFAGTRTRGRGAGGFIPNYNAVMGYGSEQGDINRGVGGAPKSARPVTIPNFNFGGGKKGTMVANTSEYMVPNFAGSGGSAIFNQDMISSMGLPSGARKVGAAGGFIPNFAKPTVRNVDFAGMIVPQKRGGRSSAQAKLGNNVYKFPVFGIDAAGEKVREEKDIKDSVKRFAVGLAKREAKTMTGGKPTAGKITKLGNQGAVGSLAGTIFETALSALLKSKDFNFGETATFDFVGANAIREIGDISPSLKNSPVRFLEAKIGSNNKTNLSMAKKIQRYFGVTASGRTITEKGRTELLGAGGGKNKFVGSMGFTKKLTGMDAVRSRVGMNLGSRGSSGYIPNFAGGLQDAIARESAAGLPINQIRVNQDSSLKNAGNPMGLAVTNTRDEPTGAIPNFATMNIGGRTQPIGDKQLNKQLDKLAKSAGKAAKGQRDMLGGIFAVQIGLSGLSGATSGAEDGLKKFANITFKAMSSMTTAAFAGSAINDFGKSIGGASGKIVSKLGLYGAALSAGISLFKGINAIIDEATGKNRAAASSMAILADATKNLAFSFDNLSEVRKVRLREEAKSIVTGKGLDLGKGIGTTTAQVPNIVSSGAMYIPQSAIDNAPLTNVEVNRGFARGKDASGQTFKEAFQKAAASLLGLGLTVEEVDAKLDSFGIGVRLGEKQLAEFADFITSTNEAVVSDTKEFAKGIEGATTEQIESIIRALKVGDVPRGVAGKQGAMDLFRFGVSDEFAEKGVGSKIPEKQKLILLEAEFAKRLQKSQDVEKKSKLLDLEKAKISIKSALDQRKAELTLTTSIEGRIKTAEILGNLSDEQLIKLKTQRLEQQLSNKLVEKRLEVLGESLGKLEELKVNQKEIDAITKEISELSEKDAKDKDIVKGLMEDILGITGKENVEVDKLVENFMLANNAAAGLIMTMNDGERSLSNMNNKAELLKLKLKDAQTSASIDSTNRAFDVTQQNQRDNEADRSLITSLNQQMATAPPEVRSRLQDQIKGVESRIGGRAVSTARAGLMDRIRQAGIDAPMEEGGGIVRGVNKSLLLGAQTPETGIAALKLMSAESDLARRGLQKIIADLELASVKDIEAAQATADAAEQAARALNEFQQAVANAELQLLQSDRMGLASESAANRRRLGAISDRRDLTPENAARLSDLQRSVGQRIVESGEFDPLLQSDRLAQTITDASINFKTNISDALVDAISKGEDLGSTLRNAAASFFNILAKGYMNQAVNSIIGGGGGGIFGSIMGGLNPLNSGGPVKGGSGTRDDVPALLTGGEFVMRTGAVKKYGARFMSALNSGQIPAMNRGGLFTPGTYGQGAMQGKGSLLDFATQGFTTGGFDSISGGSGFASIGLAPQSAALTMFGRRNSPQYGREQSSKQSAFGLYVQQVNKEKQAEEQGKQSTRGLLGSIVAAGAGFALSELFSGGKKSATGGAIPYAAGVDTVPAMLSGGEFVMNAAATQKIGRGNLASINSGGGSGGNGAVIGKLDELISVSDNQGETNINITVNSDGTSSTDGNGDEEETNLATRIRDVVKQVIDDEKRLGGSLRQARA
tara:strand:+ start:5902 stop:12144 length:6243 start_codon:yes stop_codon:yes gene_type:complete